MKKAAKYTILHNARCRKSREALTYLKEMSVDIDIIEYLKDPITKEFLNEVIGKLSIPVGEVLRKTEADFKQHFKGKSLSDKEWIQAMIAYPKLMQRPIVIKDDKAVIARPAAEINKLEA